MGYLRLWRHKQILPGVRLNVSKSGPSLSFGPRGLHYTVGRHGRRMTAGVPGTGVFYTSYSRNHARQAARAQQSPGRPTVAPPPISVSHNEPMLPQMKIILGILLIWLPPVGLILLILGLVQRNQPLWMARSLVHQARRAGETPDQASALLHQAMQIQPNSPEVLAPLAEFAFAQQNWPEAAQTYEQYLALAPADWVARGHCGMAYANAGNYDAAITPLVEVREHAPLQPDSHASVSAQLALAFLHKNDAGQGLAIAKQENLRARVLGPGGRQCLYVRAIAQYLSGHHGEAVQDLDRLYAMDPSDADVARIKPEMQAGTYSF